MPKISEEKMQERRMKILKAAFDLFADKGYSATGMRDIMKAAGVSKGGIYVHFKSKSDILLGVIEQFDGRKEKIEESLEQLSPEERLSQYLFQRLKAFQNEEARKWSRIVLEFWSLPDRVPELQEVDERRYRFFKGTMESMIEAGIEARAFRQDCPVADAAYLMMSMINGVGLMSGSMGKVITEKQIHETVKLFINYLKG